MITGTFVNSAAIIAGGAAGLLVARFGGQAHGSNKITDGVIKALGLSVTMLGIKMAFEEHDFLPIVVCLALGTCIGELAGIEKRIEQFGIYLKKLIKSRSDTFVNGFVTSSVLFCVGATGIVGALRDGLINDPSLLYVKSLLDGIVALIFASTMGVGVLFSAIPILIYQGTISLGASQLSFLMESAAYVSGISATGGIIVVGIGLNLTGASNLRVGNMLPSLILIVLYDAIRINFFP